MVGLIYGQSGAGKTVNSVKALVGKRGKNLLMSSDYSSVVLNNFPDAKKTTDIVLVDHWTDHDAKGLPRVSFIKQFEDAVASKKYDCIIIDNLTNLFETAVLEYDESKQFNDPRKYYLIIYQQIKRLVREANQVDTNVIFTCWEIIDQIPTTQGLVARIRPLLQDKLLDPVLGLCQVVAHVEHKPSKDGVETWYYNYNGSSQLYAKDQLFLRKGSYPELIFTNQEGNKQW